MDRLYPYIGAAGLAGIVSVAGLLALTRATRRVSSQVRGIRAQLREEGARSRKAARAPGIARREGTPSSRP